MKIKPDVTDLNYFRQQRDREKTQAGRDKFNRMFYATLDVIMKDTYITVPNHSKL